MKSPLQTKLFCVYALVDPRTNEDKYIGFTNNVSRRYSQHRDSYGRTKAFRLWHSELQSAGLRPDIRIIKESNDYLECEKLEQLIIRQDRSNGKNLFNQDPQAQIVNIENQKERISLNKPI